MEQASWDVELPPNRTDFLCSFSRLYIRNRSLKTSSKLCFVVLFSGKPTHAHWIYHHAICDFQFITQHSLHIYDTPLCISFFILIANHQTYFVLLTLEWEKEIVHYMGALFICPWHVTVAP